MTGLPELFVLLFIERDDEDLPGPPIAHVYVNPQAGHRHEYSGELDLLTPQLMTMQEVDEEIDWLKRKSAKELEAIRKRARKKFASHREKFASQRKRESGT